MALLVHDRVLFVHAPKAAGSWVRLVLRALPGARCSEVGGVHESYPQVKALHEAHGARAPIIFSVARPRDDWALSIWNYGTRDGLWRALPGPGGITWPARRMEWREWREWVDNRLTVFIVAK